MTVNHMAHFARLDSEHTLMTSAKLFGSPLQFFAHAAGISNRLTAIRTSPFALPFYPRLCSAATTAGRWLALDVLRHLQAVLLMYWASALVISREVRRQSIEAGRSLLP
jgi:hypothetical protein